MPEAVQPRIAVDPDHLAWFCDAAAERGETVYSQMLLTEAIGALAAGARPSVLVHRLRSLRRPGRTPRRRLLSRLRPRNRWR